MAEVDAIGKKQKEIIDLQNQLKDLGDVADPGPEPARYKGGYNRTDNKTFEYGTAYQVGKGDANTDNRVTAKYPLDTPNRKAVIAKDVKAYLDKMNKPYKDWKAASTNFKKAEKLRTKITKAEQELSQLQTDAITGLQTVQRDLSTNVLTDPSSVIKKAEVSYLDPDTEGTTIDEDDYLAPDQAKQYTATTIDPTKIDDVTAPDSIDVAKFDAVKSQDQITTAMQGVTAAQGQLSPEAIAQAAQADPSKTLVGNLQAAQGTGIMMTNPVQREIQEGEIITGAANAQKAVAFTEQIQAAQATPSQKAMVQNQLEGLMDDFQGGQTPAWAAGAMRAAMGKMAARGLGASSIAGQAVVQAAMESALPIAMADAQTVSQFEQQNLTNRQQRAMLAAQQRAAFIGQEFDQAFQARVQNASRIADIANMNFTAEQQVALENSRITNTMNLQNLSNRQAMVMAEAAAISQLEQQNLSNQQQAAVQNAQAFLQMDMANLNNRQSTAIFKAQQIAQSIFTDQAAENAARNFNASSKNQADQFLKNLQVQVSTSNANQLNAMAQFNAGQKNAAKNFNATVQNARDQFNAANRLVIAQANAAWRQNVATINTAAENTANMEVAREANSLTMKSIDELWQRERDIMDFVTQAYENEADRKLEILLADKKYDEYEKARNDAESTSMWSFITSIIFSKL